MLQNNIEHLCTFCYKSLFCLFFLLAVIAVSWQSAQAQEQQDDSVIASELSAGATVLYHPLIPKSSGTSTKLFLQNIQNTTSNVTISFYDSQNGNVIESVSVAVEYLYPTIVDLSERTGLPDGLYSARVDSAEEISSVVRIYNSDMEQLALYHGISASSAETVQYFGPFFSTEEKKSAITLLNIGAASATATITFRGLDGLEVATINDVVGVHESQAISGGDLTLSPDFNGVAEITSDLPLVGLLAQSDGGQSQNLYPSMRISSLASPASYLYLPRFLNRYRRNGGVQQTQLIAINTEDSVTEFVMTLYGDSSTPNSSLSSVIGPRESLLLLEAPHSPPGVWGDVIASGGRIALGEFTKHIEEGSNLIASYGTDASTHVAIPYASRLDNSHSILYIQTVGPEPTTMNVDFYGDNAHLLSISPPAAPYGGFVAVDTRDYPEYLQDFEGSVYIEADQPVLVWVDEIVEKPNSVFTCAEVSEIPAAECDALVAIFTSTNGDSWFYSDGWMETNTPCNWFGITCDGPHVVFIKLDYNQLAGNIPSALGNLTQLRELHLEGNSLDGSIPTTVGNLANLEQLWLSHNQLAGAIPSQLGNLTQLNTLSIGDNQFAGGLPPSFANLTQLEHFWAYPNLGGEFPAYITNFTNLATLGLSDNNFTGEIPSAIGNLAKLESLHLQGNQLTGSLPSSIGNLTELQDLYLHSNQLGGEIPPQIGMLAKLEILELRNNQLDGPLPDELGNLIKLRILGVSNNKLQGSIPASIGNLEDLEELWFYQNQLEGKIPSTLGNLTNLQNASLAQNQLIGSIPVSFGNLSGLKALYLDGNQLEGSIPSWLGDFSQLQVLSLSWNELTGPIPQELGKLTELTELYVHGNNLSGSIPDEIGSLTKLTQLALGDNQLDGPLPSALGNLVNLERMTLDRNRFSGAIPASFGNLNKLDRLYLEDNELTGALPTQLTGLTNLYTFHFYHNELCEPVDTTSRSWLNDITYLESTGLPCGAMPGGMAGVVTDVAGNPLPNIEVSLHRNTKGLGWNVWRWVSSIGTDVNGVYHFDNLGSTGYSLLFADPTAQYGDEYYDNVGTLDASTAVTPALGMTTTVNVVLDPPVAPAVDVTSESGNITTDTKNGEVIVAMPRPNKSDITILRRATCSGNSTPTAVKLIMTGDSATKTYSMTATGSNNKYIATIMSEDLAEDAVLSVEVICGSQATTSEVGRIQLYDPSGTITDATTGQPIPNAAVALYNVPNWLPKLSADDDRANTCQSHQSKEASVPWSQPAPVDLGVLVNPDLGIISPSVSRMATNSQGRYGWDVAEGCWYVVVTAEGYETLVSPVVGVPPAVTDLDLGLVKKVIATPTPAPTVTSLPTPVPTNTPSPTPVPTSTPSPVPTATPGNGVPNKESQRVYLPLVEK